MSPASPASRPSRTSAAGEISKDGHAALVDFEIRGDPDDAADKIDPILAKVDDVQRTHPEFFIGQFGDASAANAVETAAADDLGKAGLLSLPITLAILVVAFGALVAAGIPLLLALTAVFATFGLIALPSHIFPVAMQAPALVLLIGLAVGVDYTMFYLRREREERAAGRSERAALEAAAATSGRSVLISGLTVMTAMAGMFLTGDKVFASFGVATILVVAVAMLGSLTVLPALLSRLGDNVDRVRIPFVSRLRRDDGEGRIWGGIVDRVLRRPGSLGPARRWVPGRARAPGAPAPDGAAWPRHVPEVPPAVQTYDRMQQAFPGGAPGQRGRQGAERERPTMRAAIERLEQRALASGRMYEPITVEVNEAGTVANITVPIEGQGHRRGVSNASLAVLRDEILPTTVGALPDAEAGVTGLTASWIDSTNEMKASLLPVVGIRARVRLRADARRLPLARDRGEGDRAQPALGRRRLRRARARLPARRRQGPARVQLDGRDRPVVPLLLFVILFGLSMDYHVFLLSRIREVVQRGASTEEAVSQGIKTTAGVVTSAAIVMVVRLRRLHRALDADVQAVRRRARGGDPDRRDDRPRRAAAGLDEAARRLELVPAELARVAASLDVSEPRLRPRPGQPPSPPRPMVAPGPHRPGGAKGRLLMTTETSLRSTDRRLLLIAAAVLGLPTSAFAPDDPGLRARGGPGRAT